MDCAINPVILSGPSSYPEAVIMLYIPCSCSSFQSNGPSALFVRPPAIIKPRTKVKYLLCFVESNVVAVEDQTYSRSRTVASRFVLPAPCCMCL